METEQAPWSFLLSNSWEFLPHYMNYFGSIMRERGREFFLTEADLLQMTGHNHMLTVGVPQHIVEKMVYQHETLGISRFMLQLDIGGQPFSRIAEAIELLAREVAPAVRRKLANND